MKFVFEINTIIIYSQYANVIGCLNHYEKEEYGIFSIQNSM